jgi:hypothetical protein
MLVVEEKVTKKQFPHLYQKKEIPIYKKKTPKMHVKEVKKNTMGSKRYLINKKNQNVYQRCTEKQEEHITKNH